ncbi:MAG TPA: membrane dipeptidase [Thermoanaerobaculia bacterium]|nr:membrane dipeptidase [Thermoanaerobaculia bacterium]
MDRRRFLRGVVMAGAGAFAAPMLNLGRCRVFADDGASGGGPLRSVRAIDLMGEAAVIDMLGLLTLDWPRLTRWQREPGSFGEGDFARLRASGIDVFHPAVEPNQPDAVAAVSRWLDGWDRLLVAYPGYFVRVDTVADVARAKAEGKIGLILGFQNSDHFTSVADVEAFRRRGQRVSQLTYNTRNRIGSGCQVADDGLTPFGADVVEAMNRAGMAVDVSHCSERTTLGAFAASTKPVLITHSNCRALVGHPRCKSDEVLRAMAASGGVMGITAVRAFVRQPEEPSIDNLLDHFDHVARVAGPEHVGLGSDVDVDARDPKSGQVRPAYAIRGLDPARRTFEVVEGLLRRGWLKSDVEGVVGGNFRRALASIWGAAPAEPLPLPVPAQPIAS